MGGGGRGGEGGLYTDNAIRYFKNEDVFPFVAFLRLRPKSNHVTMASDNRKYVCVHRYSAWESLVGVLRVCDEFATETSCTPKSCSLLLLA